MSIADYAGSNFFWLLGRDFIGYDLLGSGVYQYSPLCVLNFLCGFFVFFKSLALGLTQKKFAGDDVVVQEIFFAFSRDHVLSDIGWKFIQPFLKVGHCDRNAVYVGQLLRIQVGAATRRRSR